MTKPTHERRRKSDMSDVSKILTLALLVAGAFLAGVLTANHQVRQIVDETQRISAQVKNDLQAEIERQDREFSQHRDRDRLHICTAGLDHLSTDLALYDIATQAGLDPTKVRTSLRPEVVDICAEIGINGSGRH